MDAHAHAYLISFEWNNEPFIKYGCSKDVFKQMDADLKCLPIGTNLYTVLPIASKSMDGLNAVFKEHMERMGHLTSATIKGRHFTDLLHGIDTEKTIDTILRSLRELRSAGHAAALKRELEEENAKLEQTKTNETIALLNKCLEKDHSPVVVQRVLDILSKLSM